jgi:hypothetical protein
MDGVNSTTAPTGEMLTDYSGAELPAKFVSQTIPRVSTKPHYLRFITLPMELPPPELPIQAKRWPIRVTVQADEIPDDVEEYSQTHEVHVRRRQ